MMKARNFTGIFVAAIWMTLTHPAVHACTACFGKTDSNMAKGMNVGIFALLLVITSVLCGVAGFFVFLAKRGNQLEESHLANNITQIEPTSNR